MAASVIVDKLPPCVFSKRDNPGVDCPSAARYDFPTVSGQWGFGCEYHWEQYRRSPELGTGLGQRLLLPGETWVYATAFKAPDAQSDDVAVSLAFTQTQLRLLRDYVADRIAFLSLLEAFGIGTRESVRAEMTDCRTLLGVLRQVKSSPDA